ncbi:MAG: hypothetical protein CMF50_04085 [Legionellales bacterium]|nr:hypothetical protein [Legionellales bacterium]|tara:strand:+ start:769 stop:1203 length:435 start_codon:yes stop_codon:yes gene_type:complete
MKKTLITCLALAFSSVAFAADYVPQSQLINNINFSGSDKSIMCVTGSDNASNYNLQQGGTFTFKAGGWANFNVYKTSVATNCEGDYIGNIDIQTNEIKDSNKKTKIELRLVGKDAEKFTLTDKGQVAAQGPDKIPVYRYTITKK